MLSTVLNSRKSDQFAKNSVVNNQRINNKGKAKVLPPFIVDTANVRVQWSTIDRHVANCPNLVSEAEIHLILYCGEKPL